MSHSFKLLPKNKTAGQRLAKFLMLEEIIKTFHVKVIRNDG